MSRAYLCEADLSRAYLHGANLSRADLSGANLDEARFDEHTRWPENFDPKAAGALMESEA
jgi:uncharacterized protein YjbI with pentapeptide repeats